MSRVKTTQIISLLGILLLGACSSVERGVVVGKGHSLRSTPTMPTDYYWVDVRGRNADGERVTERIGLFKRDWERFHDGDAISPHDFDLIGATKSLRSSLDKIARIGGKPKPEPARTKTAQSRVPASRKSPPQTPSAKVGSARPRPVAQTAGNPEERFRSVEARAHNDAAVRELKLRIHNAKTDDEQAATWREYRSALFQKMRDLDPSLKGRIDAAESAPGGAGR